MSHRLLVTLLQGNAFQKKKKKKQVISLILILPSGPFQGHTDISDNTVVTV